MFYQTFTTYSDLKKLLWLKYFVNAWKSQLWNLYLLRYFNQNLFCVASMHLLWYIIHLKVTLRVKNYLKNSHDNWTKNWKPFLGDWGLLKFLWYFYTSITYHCRTFSNVYQGTAFICDDEFAFLQLLFLILILKTW